MQLEDFNKALDEKPDDYDLRLVYADWLEENNLVDEAYTQRWMVNHDIHPLNRKKD